MSTFWAQDWIVFPAVGMLTFVVAYLWSDKILTFFYNRSLGQREEILRLMNRMFVETDEKKLTRTLLLISFGSGILVFTLAWPNLILGLIFSGVFTILGWTVPKLVVRGLHEKRSSRFVDQMVEGLTIMSNGISSGLSVTQSMERVVENMGNPISQEFALVLSEVRLGKTVEEALVDLGERIPKPDVQMFVSAITILKETGGNMAETFATIVITIRERQKVEKKIEALTAQGLMQGVIITLVPFVLLLVFFAIDPNYIMPLFTTTLGIIMFLMVIVLQIIGGLAIRKIVKINV